MKQIYFYNEGVKEVNFEYVFEKYIGLIKSRVTKWLNREEYDDLFQEASIGMWLAYETYSNLDIGFTYYADRVIRNRLSTYAHKRNQKYTSHVSRVLSLVSLDEIENYAASGSELDNEVVDRVILHDIIRSLGDRDRVLLYYVSQGYKQQEISEKMNVSQPVISRDTKKMARRISKMYLVG